MLLWILAVILIPVVTVGMLVVSMAEDFWKLIRFRLGFERLFGDLFHAVLIILAGFGFEVFALIELIRHL